MRTRRPRPIPPRRPETYKDFHQAGDIAEKKLAQAIVARWKFIKSRISRNELAVALHAKDQRKALQIVEQFLKMDNLNAGIRNTMKEAYLTGGRLGAKRIKVR